MTWFAVVYADVYKYEDGEFDIDCGILGIFDNEKEAQDTVERNFDNYDKLVIESW